MNFLRGGGRGLRTHLDLPQIVITFYNNFRKSTSQPTLLSLIHLYQIHVVFKQTDVVFKQTDVVFKQRDVVFKQRDVVFKQTDVVFKQTDVVFKQRDLVFE